jgi:glyoxylase-like metal-dependent hydrolase (beta-lactamase superfamily II)
MTLPTDRRTFLKTGALIAGGLAMPQLMVRASHAQVARPDVASPGFRRFTLGGFEVTTILDGRRPMDDPAAIFGENQSAEDVAAVLETHNLPTDRFVNGFTPTLVNTGEELVLFDSGLGEGARGGGLGQLRDRMEASGYAPEDVTIVVITHFHGDHIGGLTEGEGPAFPNARYVTGQAEYDFWTASERMSGPTENAAKAVEAKVKPFAENMTFIGEGDAVVSGITAMEAFGHTPGHLIFMLESDGRQLALTADTANHYLVSLQRPDWHVRFDMDKEAGAATRKRVFDMIASDRIPFIGYHMPSVGFVETMDTGFRFIPETYQLEL